VMDIVRGGLLSRAARGGLFRKSVPFRFHGLHEKDLLNHPDIESEREDELVKKMLSTALGMEEAELSRLESSPQPLSGRVASGGRVGSHVFNASARRLFTTEFSSSARRLRTTEFSASGRNLQQNTSIRRLVSGGTARSATLRTPRPRSLTPRGLLQPARTPTHVSMSAI